MAPPSRDMELVLKLELERRSGLGALGWGVKAVRFEARCETARAAIVGLVGCGGHRGSALAPRRDLDDLVPNARFLRGTD